MKKEQQKRMQENHEAIFAGIQKVLSDHGLEDLKLSGLEFEVHDEPAAEAAMLRVSNFTCPQGYRKVLRIHPITGEERLDCVPL